MTGVLTGFKNKVASLFGMRLQTFAALPRGLGVEQATHDLLRYFTQQLPDPDEVLRKAGLRRADLRRIEADDEVLQCRDKRVDAVIAVPWHLEPNASRNSKFIAAELEPWIETVVICAMQSVFFGYSVAEAVFVKRNDGRTGIADYAEKPFEWFIPKHGGELRYFPADGRYGSEGMLCDPLKYVLTVAGGTYRNPYGESIYSRLWWPVFFRSQGWRYWVKFLERFGTPTMMGKTAGDLDSMAERLARAVQDAVIVTGITDEISALEIGKDGQQFKMFEDAVTARIQKTILGQTLTSQIGSSGSFAAAKVHQNVMNEKRNADIRLVQRSAQRLVDSLCYLNGFERIKIMFADETGLEMERAERDALLADKGIVRFTDQYLLDRYDFIEGDFTIPEDKALPPAGPPAPTSDNPQAAAAQMRALTNASAARIRFSPGQQVIEDGIAATLGDLRPPVDSKALAAAIAEATSVEDLEDRLIVAFKHANTAEFQEVMARGMFAAEILGFAHAGGGRDAAKVEAAAAPAPVPNITFHAPITLQMPEHPATPVTPPQPINITVEPTPVSVQVQPTPVTIETTIQPAPVTVQMNHPKSSVQEIERDPETQEITRTTTIYQE